MGLKTILVERYPDLGGVCLNVGCIPSKALLHVAASMEAAQHLSDHGISFGPPAIDLERLRGWRNSVVGKLTTGLKGLAKQRKVQVLRGEGHFIDPRHVAVALTAGDGREPTERKTIVRFEKCIIAAGSEAVRLPFLPDDRRILSSTDALALPLIPEKLLVIGGGIIGLEMATIYSALGARVDIVEATDRLMPGPDDDLVAVWYKMNKHRFDRVMLNTKTISAEARADGIWVGFDGAGAPLELQRYDLVLQAVGRRANGHKIGADAAGIAVSAAGVISVDSQMRTNASNIFAIGDIVGTPMLAHKAVHQGHVAAEVAAGLKSHFDAQVIPSVAYTDPEIAWVGLTEAEAQAHGLKVGVGKFPWAASGRAIANGRDEGFTKLIFNGETGRIIGGGIAGTHAGDMLGEIVLAIEMGADAMDLGKTIHPHPTLGETIGLAAEAFEGICTDLPKV